MARVPAAENLIQPQAPTNAKFRAASPVPSGFGEGLENFGAAMERASGTLANMAQTEAESVALEQDNAATARKNEILYGEHGFFNQHGKAALDAFPQVQQQLQQIDRDAVEAIGRNPLSARLYNDFARRRNEAIAPRVLQHRADQGEFYADQVDKGAIDQALDSAINATGDEQEIQRQIMTGEGIVARQLARKGVTDLQNVADQQRAFRSRIVAGVADRLSLNSALQAKDYVESHASQIDATEESRLLDTLKGPARAEWADAAKNNYIVMVGGGDGTAAAPQAGGSHAARSVRNNNPGNLVDSSWTRQQPGFVRQDGGGYAVFDTPEHGEQAHGALLANRYFRGGTTTVRRLIERYAPRKSRGGDNTDAQTDNYISFVAKRLNVSPDDTITTAYIPRLMAAQHVWERGATGKAGAVRTGGAETQSAAAAPQRPEVDLRASFDRIDADQNLSFEDRETLKQAVQRRYSLIRQSSDAEEQRVGDAAWRIAAQKGGEFLGLNDLPPSIRSQLTGRQIEALSSKAESNAVDAAYAAIEPLGGRFTDTAQIPSGVWAAMPAHAQFEFKSMADRNALDEHSLADIQQRMAAGAPLDPKDEKTRKAVDLDYLARWHAFAASPHSADDTLRWVSSYVDRVGFLPPSLIGGVRANLRSADPGMQMGGARLIRAITARNPNLIKDFSEEDISRGVSINRYIDSGYKPQEAIERVNEDERITPQQRQARSDLYAQLTSKKQASFAPAIVRQVFGNDVSGMTSVGAQGSQLVADFDELRKQEFLRSGNMEAANATALQLLRREWGVTRVNGSPQIMKYAPEMFYGTGGDPKQDAKWIHEQAVHDLLGNGIAMPDAPERLSLIPHPTVPPIDGKPVYAGLLREPDGTLRTLMDERGRPRVFVPEFSSSKEFERQKRRERETIAAARRARQGSAEADHQLRENPLSAIQVVP
jgi:hypothetical protein